MRRAMVATGTALLGGIAYRLFQMLLDPEVLPNCGFIGLAFGAIGSTLAWYDPRPRAWLDHLLPALFIVEVTLACVGVSIGVFTSRSDLLTVLAATGSLLFFAFIYASWWLVPTLATVLWAANRLAAKYESTWPVGPTP